MNRWEFLKKWPFYAILACVIIIGYFSIPPQALFNDPISLVINSRDGELLGAHIASDEQWRLPYDDCLPEKFIKTITLYEDHRFFSHPGIDPLAIARAIRQNMKAKEIVSGGSTITMQLMRLSRKGKPRTYFQKFIECILAVKTELHYSKQEILATYATHAPFGGNIVGLHTASWRYYGKKAKNLTWAETAMLCVLPNSPALIHPGKNRNDLLKKRNDLLNRLQNKGIISSETLELALLEPLADEPVAFPNHAPHLLTRILRNKKADSNAKVNTSIITDYQIRANKVLIRHHKKLASNDINNIALLILEVETGEILAYNGNVIFDKNTRENAGFVDNISAERSTGSILKPFLYAAMLSSGEILPNALVPDIPTNIGGFIPKNYNRGYDGAIPAYKALARSLNIPAVRMLKQYGVPRFYHVLEKSGITTLHRSYEDYGLSLILGGAEATLWDLTGAYASMARSLMHYPEYSSRYSADDYHPPCYTINKNDSIHDEDLEKHSFLSASSIWLSFEALLNVERPAEETGWEYFNNAQKIAWKTGTSFGFRDAWAIGITPKFAVGVWVGNADGEGRPGLTGINAAAPILFDVFSFLPESEKWFEKPFDDFETIKTCKASGYQATKLCKETVELAVPLNGIRFHGCPYHQMIHLDNSGTYRVHSHCEDPDNMIHLPWFILPPTIEWFYKRKNPAYQILPEYRADCMNDLESRQKNSMQVIYPQDESKLFIPVEITGVKGRAIFEVAHRNDKATIYWHMDDDYLGKTKEYHQFEITGSIGKHQMTLIDNRGEMLTFDFEIINE